MTPRWSNVTISEDLTGLDDVLPDEVTDELAIGRDAATVPRRGGP